MSAEFVDTNIHVYSQDATAGDKHAVACGLVARIFEERTGVTSIQVLCELYAVITGKVRQRVTSVNAIQAVEDIAQWRVHEPNVANVRRAIDRSIRHSMSFWDAMVVESAIAMDCSVLWTEDLQHDAVHDGVRVRNPFVRGV